MTSREEYSSRYGSSKSSNVIPTNMTKEKSRDKIDVSFKSIHEQIQEQNEKKQQISNQGSKKSLYANLEIDEKLLNLLSINQYKKQIK